MNKIISIITIILGILLTIVGIILKASESASFSIIGGADGPTSVIVAGNLGNDLSLISIVASVILVIIGIIIFVVGKKK